MTLFYSGSATIDEQMVLRKADESFYKFIGKNIYGSVIQCIHPEDLHRFQGAFNELQSNDLVKNLITVRIQNNSGYDWGFIELTHEPFDLNGRPLIHLNVFTLAEDSEHTSNLQKINTEHETLLNLLGGILLSFDSKTDLFSVFMNCDGQKISLYQGNFKEWKESLLNGRISYDSVNEFNALCAAIETGKKEFTHNIITNAFTEDESMELCTFKCRSIPESNSSHKVLGCISISSTQKEAAPDIRSNMDIGIPILNKKAITEYAKRAMLKKSGNIHLIILDLDDFKTINDTYGHMFGDEVLVKASSIIKEAIGNAGIVGRIGGDEMMIVLTQIESHAELRNMLRSIRTGIEWAYKGGQDNLRVTCSMGIATYPDHGDNYDKIFQLADRMLYIAKNKGKNRYVIYTPEIHDAAASKNAESVKDNSLEILRDDKAGVMQRLIEDFLIRKIVPYAAQLKEIGFCFELDEIIMVYGDMKMSSTWNHQGFFDDIESQEYLNPDPFFLTSFNENNIFAVNGIFNLEGKSPVLAGLLTQRGIESALFYKMVKNNNMFGYIMFAKKNRRQMWSEYDKTLLASVGKIIEISFKG